MVDKSVIDKAEMVLVKIDDGIYKVSKNRYENLRKGKFVDSGGVVIFLNTRDTLVIDKNNELITTSMHLNITIDEDGITYYTD